MSTQIIPALQGLGYDVTRSPLWNTINQAAVSGKETRIALWSYPRWQWQLKYNFMRQGTLDGITTYTEFEQYVGFFNILNGAFNSFLYQDYVDNSVTGQGIGYGDGVTTQFQLVRAFGNFVEPMFAPNVVANVYIGGVLQSAAVYTVSKWGSATPGILTFLTPPSFGLAITVDFSYYFPCRFLEDTLEFNQSLSTVWGLKSAKFISIKG